jgi:hypothetical protein
MMSDFSGMGRVLIVIGLVIAGIGFVMVFAGKIPLAGQTPRRFLLPGEELLLLLSHDDEHPDQRDPHPDFLVYQPAVDRR